MAGRMRFRLVYAVVAALVLMAAAAACTRQPSQPPPPKDIPVVAQPSFRQDIQPILDEFCVKCHQPADAHGDLRLNSYQDLMRGSRVGPVVNRQRPEESLLLQVLKHRVPEGMPFHTEPLTPNRITTIENWLRMGAPDN